MDTDPYDTDQYNSEGSQEAKYWDRSKQKVTYSVFHL